MNSHLKKRCEVKRGSKQVKIRGGSVISTPTAQEVFIAKGLREQDSLRWVKNPKFGCMQTSEPFSPLVLCLAFLRAAAVMNLKQPPESG